MTAREAALQIQERCHRDGAWSSLAMDRVLQQSQLEPRDAALASLLALGVLQNDRLCDFYIDCFSSIRAEKLEPRVRDILRMGVYQIVFMDRIPPHAAVSESVELCKRSGCARALGLVNAVLRKLAKQKDCLPEVPGKGSVAYLATRYSQQEWLAERLITQRGYDFAERFFAACNMPAMIDLQINTTKVDAGSYWRSLERMGFGFELPAFPENCVSVRGGRVPDYPGYEDGLFYVQDRAACMALEIADVRPAMRVLDACAAPGGKSFAAAIRMQNHGQVLSCDIHEKKLALIRSGAERLGLDCIQTAAADAREERREWRDAFDLVIADVPCSGLGVMRKKPEIRYKKESEIAGLPVIQYDILKNLARYVRPGGTLLYATCTVLREENEELVSRFLEGHSDFTPLDFSVGERRSERGMYGFWPHIDGTDGFFAAKLKRADR